MLILDREEVSPNSRFCDADVAYVLAYLADNRRATRRELAEYLDLRDCSVHSLLMLMEEHELITALRKGVFISETGRMLYREMGLRVVYFDVPYALGPYMQAIKISGVVGKITDGIQQMKISTASGGLGCAIWVRNSNSIFMPSHLSLNKENVELTRLIQDVAKLCDGDVLLVCGGESRRAARLASMSVALDLV